MAGKFAVGDRVTFKAGIFEEKAMNGIIRFVESDSFYTVKSNGQNYTIHGRDLTKRILNIRNL